MFGKLEKRRAKTNSQVMSIVTDILEKEGVSGLDDLFGTIGTDSLNSVKLINVINLRFGKKLSLSTLQNSSSIDEITDFLVASDTIGDIVDSAQEEKNQEAMNDLRKIHRALFRYVPIPGLDAQASAEAQALPPVPEPEPFKSPERILLTGATGFLGAFLAYEFLDKYPESEVFCLIRGRNTEAGVKRIKDTFQMRKSMCQPHARH